MVSGVPGRRARTALVGSPGQPFADVRWVAETGSTNADAMALARQGEPEGIVLVADHQTAGRGRAGRTWSAPPGASLLCSVLLRPPAAVVDLCTMAVAVAAAAAVAEVAGVTPRLKWPNDLVWPGDGSAPDRKLAGILAEADWPASSPASGGWRPPATHERAAVVVGIGINVAWPDELPDELTDVAVALSHLVDRPVDREDLLIALLSALGPRYGSLVAGDRSGLLARVAGPLRHPGPAGAGRPRHRRRGGHRGRHHRRRPPRGRDPRGHPPPVRRRRRRPPPLTTRGDAASHRQR